MSFQTICEASRGAFESIRACYLLGQVVPSICLSAASSPMYTAGCSQRCTDSSRTGVIEGLRRVSSCLPVSADRQRSRQTLPNRCARLIEGGMKEVGSTRAHRARRTCRIDSSRSQLVLVPLRPRTLAAKIIGARWRALANCSLGAQALAILVMFTPPVRPS